MVKTHIDIEHISNKLGEPGGFYEWRKYLGDLATSLTAEDAYGLSISVDQGVFRDALFTDDGIEYTFHNADGAHAFPWKEVVDNKELSEKVHALLNWSAPKLSKDHYIGLFASSFQDAHVVHIGSGEQGTVRLSSVCTKDTSDMVCVIAEENAQLVVIDDVAIDDSLLARTILIQTKADAQVTYVYSRSGNGSLHTTVVSDVQTNGRLEFTNMSRVVQGVSKIHSESYLTGQGAHVHTGHVTVSTHGVSDIQDIAIHDASHTNSVLGAAGVAEDSGTIIYRSDIVMKKEGTLDLAGAQKAKFLVMTKDAEVDAIPSLDIAQKDVSCSHSVSVSHLKEDDTFYPRLRGINLKDAESMLVEGLLIEPVLHAKEHADVIGYIENALRHKT